MSIRAAHRVCCLVVASLMLAGLADRAPGKGCCGEGEMALAERVACTPVREARGGICGHCSADDAPAPVTVTAARDDSCPTEADRDCGGRRDESDPCHGGACAAVCCHVNALTTAPPAVAAVAEIAAEVAFADHALPARADGDAIFHPPRA